MLDGFLPAFLPDFAGVLAFWFLFAGVELSINGAFLLDFGVLAFWFFLAGVEITLSIDVFCSVDSGVFGLVFWVFFAGVELNINSDGGVLNN